jgi:hypothetical protein
MTTTALLVSDSEPTCETLPASLQAEHALVAKPVEERPEHVQKRYPDFHQLQKEGDAFREALRRRATTPLVCSDQYQPRHWGLKE